MNNRIEISRSALLHNYDLLAKASGLELIPVVKSDGYGHGVELVAKILSERNPPYVAVNDVREAKAIQDVCDQPILILGVVETKDLLSLDRDKVAIYVHDRDFISSLGKLDKRLKIHLDIDTGMKRYGIDETELDECLDLIEKYDNLELDGVASHLADGDAHDFSFIEEQVSKFDNTVAKIQARGFNPEYVHLANAPGFSKVNSKHATSFRPGIAIYGINPLTEDDPNHDVMSGVQPAMRLVSTVTKIRSLKAGESVSYGRTFTADKDMKIAVIPLGYYEGLPRSLSNEGSLKYGDEFLPIVGRVCMNHTMLDVTEKDINVGDEIVVFSSDKLDSNSIEQLSKDYYFFSYGLLTKLNSYIERRIID